MVVEHDGDVVLVTPARGQARHDPGGEFLQRSAAGVAHRRPRGGYALGEGLSPALDQAIGV